MPPKFDWKTLIPNINIAKLTDNQKFWLIFAIILGTSFLWSWWFTKVIFTLGMVIFCLMLSLDVFEDSE